MKQFITDYIHETEDWFMIAYFVASDFALSFSVTLAVIT